MKFIHSHWFAIGFILIILTATFFRFFNFSNRWGLAYDQAHDVLVARHAIRIKELPLVGPFSSGAPIQTSGIWYWVIMVGTLINFSSVLSPWVFITLLYICVVGALIIIGKNIYGNFFGLLVGLLSSISPSLIAQSVNLTNTGATIFATVLAIISMQQYIKSKKEYYLFFLAIFATLGVTIHLSGIALIFLLVTTLLFNLPVSKKTILFVIAGVIIPLLPNLIFDLQHDFVHSRNFIHYITVDQYKIPLEVLGRRWLTYLGVFWPKVWSYIVGGNLFVGYFLIISSIYLSLYACIARRIKKDLLIVIISFIFAVILIRYVRTPLFYSYFIFLHPFIFITTAWVLYRIFLWNKYIGSLCITVVVVSTSFISFQEISHAENSKDKQISTEINQLLKKIPDKKISLYDFGYNTVEESVPLSLYLDVKGKIAEDGVKVGVAGAGLKFSYAQPIASGSSVFILATSSAQLKKDKWVSVNSKSIYEATEKWYK